MQAKRAGLNWKLIAQMAGGGALMGGSIATILGLIRKARQMEQQKKELQEPETSEDTIVVTVPKREPETLPKAASTYTDPSTEPQSGSRVMDADPDKDTPSGSNIAKGNATGRPDDIVINVQAEPPSGDVFSAPHSGHPRQAASGQYARIPSTKATQTTSPYVGKQSNDYRGNSESMKGRVPVIMAKTATGWKNTTAAILAALGGGALGAHVVNRVFQMQREKELKEQLKSVQNEYAQQLMGDKQAGVFIETLCGQEKQAVGATSIINLPMVTAGLLYALGAGSSAYITKKILDEKFREAEAMGKDLPRVRRIVFKSVSPKREEQVEAVEEQLRKEQALEEAEKQSEVSVDIGPTTLMCLLAITDDHLTGTTRITGDPLVKAAAAGLGMDLTKLAIGYQPADLMAFADRLEKDMADPQYAPYAERLGGHLVGQWMRNRPIVRWFAPMAENLPFVRRMGARAGVSHIRELARQRGGLQQPARMPASPPMPEWMEGVRPPSGIGMTAAAEAPQVQVKRGVVLSTPSLLAGMVGQKLVRMEPSMTDQLVKAEEQLEKRKKDEAIRRDPETVVSAIRLEANDPAAQQYLKKNKKRVQALLHELAEHGQL